MRQRILLALAAGVAIVAGVIGVVVAVGLGGDDASPGPTGEQTILRIQTDLSEASCGDTVVASIYLDDLEFRASMLDATLPAGLVAFELPLVYDAAVLQIGDASNIVLNDALDEVDSDADGVTRNWIPVSYINDGEGWAMLAASSYNTASTGKDEENREEGLVPSAEAAPILLATVRFSVIGEGDANVSIEGGEEAPFQRGPIKLFAPGERRYEDAAVEAAKLNASGGDCSDVVVSTPIPTRAPAEAPALPPTRVIPSPEWLTPEESDARPDCNENLAAHVDPASHFSLCYPVSWRAVTVPPEADFGTVIQLLGPEGSSITAYWKRSTYFDEGQEPCTFAPGWLDTEEKTITVAGVEGRACSGREENRAEDTPPLQSTLAEVPIDGGANGYLVLFVTKITGDEYSAERFEADGVISSVRFGS